MKTEVTFENKHIRADGYLIVTGRLVRQRRGHGYRFSDQPPSPPPAPVRRPARVAQMLAFAHHLQAAIARGEYRDQADAARELSLTRARITQLLNLTLLAPDLQEEILFLEAVDGREPLSERALRSVVSTVNWAEQRTRWAAVTTKNDS